MDYGIAGDWKVKEREPDFIFAHFLFLFQVQWHVNVHLTFWADSFLKSRTRRGLTHPCSEIDEILLGIHVKSATIDELSSREPILYVPSTLLDVRKYLLRIQILTDTHTTDLI